MREARLEKEKKAAEAAKNEAPKVQAWLTLQELEEPTPIAIADYMFMW